MERLAVSVSEIERIMDGQMWNHVASMFTSRSPVYWVNQHMVQDYPPPPLPHHPPQPPPYQVMPCAVMDSGCGLWHAAPQGTTQHQLMMEPQEMLQTYPQVFPPMKQPQVFVSSCPPPYQFSKTSLNPNAQEWVPKEYRIPCQDTAKVKDTPIPAPVSRDQGFCEITEKEVEDIRTLASPSSTHTVKQCQGRVPQCPPIEVTQRWTGEPAEKGNSEKEGVDRSPQCQSAAVLSQPEEMSPRSSPAVIFESEVKSPAVSSCSESECSTVGQEKTSSGLVCVDGSTSRTQRLPSPETVKESVGRPQADSLTEHLTNQVPVMPNKASITSQDSCSAKNQDCASLGRSVCAEVLQGRATEDSSSLSYAGVVGRVSPPPPPPVDTTKFKYKGVEQPIPKIFQGDCSPTRQSEAPRVTNDRRTPELFKRPSKSQRKRSRRFLQELKELGQNRDICGSPSSVSDISVTSDDLSTPPMSPEKSLTLASSPLCRVPPLALSPQPESHVLSASPLPGTPTMSSPLAVPIPIPASTTGSPSSRTRTSSESSGASLDIEFVETDEVDRAVPDRATPTKRSPGAGGRNGFLACILGSGESDSETDEDSDWDECEVDSAPTLDDSWETFGFGLVVVECRMAPLGSQVQCQKPQEVPETQVGEHSSDPLLCEVNRKWKEEVQKDVQGKTNQRVTFGKETVHPMVVWGHAYRQARRGPWEQQARDRARFAQRVASLEAELSLVLDPGHRRRVYRRLYAPPSRCFL
ncbi:Protein phosphatase 1 regulatory subunit 15A [Portunus trituberculatus]|uniref:Protein phosphatase 1 regulatory subunit 15A n=1 Tax=Portunus trituberculatus TaxID=210409 RepID=A0A5B7EPA1_PORTR|nr:Protein phosphatase 1 regulatory subunit 15A [Portunus trituberculatus]